MKSSDKYRPASVLANVVEDVRDGSWIEVTCVESAYKEGSAMRGLWTFYLITPLEGEADFRSMIVKWRTLQPKTITTIVGLAAMAIEVGIRLPVFPLVAGEVGIWRYTPPSES